MRRIIIGAGIPAALIIWFVVLDVATTRSFATITDDLFHWDTPHGGHTPFDTVGSTLTVAGWALAVGICVLTAMVTRRRLFWALGALSSFLLIDDAFAIHDYWIQHFIAGDRGEQTVLLVQIAALAVILAKGWHHITDRAVLVGAGAAFALGLVADHPDALHVEHYDWLVYLDDGLKMIGIGLWVAWLTSMSVGKLRSA